MKEKRFNRKEEYNVERKRELQYRLLFREPAML